jgi:hypothetical protein
MTQFLHPQHLITFTVEYPSTDGQTVQLPKDVSFGSLQFTNGIGFCICVEEPVGPFLPHVHQVT